MKKLFLLIPAACLILPGCGGGANAKQSVPPPSGTPAIPFTQGCTPGGNGIPCTYWGIQVNKLTSYPLQVPYGEFRGWDSGKANWPEIETQANTFDWTNLDTELSNLKQATVNDVFYTLSRTPPWASKDPNDPRCDYYVLGPSDQGSCYPPTDIDGVVPGDAKGPNLIWRNWVAAIASHVNDPTYLQTHAHIKYWEPWNEFHRSTVIADTTGTLSWQGNYDQLVRLMEDARCIISGKIDTISSTGETCQHVLSTVTSVVALKAPVDPNAMMSMPSSAVQALAVIQNLLYCDDSPKAPCTVGSAGANAMDIVNVHLYASTATPEAIAQIIPAMQNILQPAERNKPLWNGEGSWGNISKPNVIWNGDVFARAGFIPRYFALYWSAGVTENFWYGYDFGSTGQLYAPLAGQLNQPEANAWILTYNWLVGAVPKTSPFCQSSGTVYHCDFTAASGHSASLVWDSQYGPPAVQICSTMSAPILCGNTRYAVPSVFNSDWIDLSGTVHTAASTVVIGANPILLEGQ